MLKCMWKCGRATPLTNNMKGFDILETMQKSPMSHPSPMKGKKVPPEVLEQRREQRRLRELARQKRQEEESAAEQRRVAAIEKLIENEAIDPNYRAQLVLMMKDEYRYYPKKLC